MSRPSYDTREDYLGAGNKADYSFDFKITDKSHLLVKVYDADLELQFSVDGNDTDDLSSVTFDPIAGGGEVILDANLPTGYHLVILLNPVFNQPDRYRDAGDFDLFSLEQSLDYQNGQIQTLKYWVDRCLKLSDAVIDAFNVVLMPRANAVPVVNEDNDGIDFLLTSEFVPTIEFGTGVPSVDLGIEGSTYIQNDTGEIYKKISGVWVYQTSIVGPPGPQGDPGDPGDPGADGASAVPVTVGSMVAPQIISTDIPFSSINYNNVIYVVSNGGEVTPDIDPPTAEGQRLTIIGTSDTDYPLLDTTPELEMQNGVMLVKNRSMITLYATSELIWQEESRNA